MYNPFITLGVADDADDDAVRQAYRQLMRQYPPERDAKAFQAIRDAYEALKTAEGRAKYRIFGPDEPITNLLELVPPFRRTSAKRCRVGIEPWLTYLREEAPHA